MNYINYSDAVFINEKDWGIGKKKLPKSPISVVKISSSVISRS